MDMWIMSGPSFFVNSINNFFMRSSGHPQLKSIHLSWCPCWVFTGVYITHDLMVAMCAGWDSCHGEVQSVGRFSVFGSPIRCHWLQTGNHSSKQTEEGGRTVWTHSSLCCWRTGNTLWFYILKFKTPKVIRFVVTENLTFVDLRVIYLY